MSILLGTSVGKVYLYSLSKGKVVCKRGESTPFNNISGLDWMQEVDPFLNQDRSIAYATKKGDLVLSNLDDELRTIGDKVVPNAAVGFVQVGRSFLVGDNQGSIKIVPYDFDKNELIYSLGETSDLLKDSKITSLTQMRADPFNKNKLVILRADKPPMVVSFYQFGVRHRKTNHIVGRQERPSR